MCECYEVQPHDVRVFSQCQLYVNIQLVCSESIIAGGNDIRAGLCPQWTMKSLILTSRD